MPVSKNIIANLYWLAVCADLMKTNGHMFLSLITDNRHLLTVS